MKFKMITLVLCSLISVCFFTEASALDWDGKIIIYNQTNYVLKPNWQPNKSSESYFYAPQEIPPQGVATASFGANQDGFYFIGYDIYDQGKAIGGCTYKFSVSAYYSKVEELWNYDGRVTLVDQGPGKLSCPAYESAYIDIVKSMQFMIRS